MTDKKRRIPVGPRSNFFKLPNVVMEFISEIPPEAFNILIYILRHTWGFQEYRKAKRISLDEFVNGRKRKDGSRLDNGCGIGRSSVRKYLKLLIDMDVLRLEIDDSDKARIKKSYALQTFDDEEDDDLDVEDIDERTVLPGNTVNPCIVAEQHPECCGVTPRVLPGNNRTEKDTNGKTLNKKDTRKLSSKADDPPRDSPSSNRTSGFFDDDVLDETPEDDLAARSAKRLHHTLVEKRLISKSAKPRAWARQLREWIIKEQMDESFFLDVFDWYLDNIGKEFVPEAYSVRSVVNKFYQIARAKKRAESTSTQETYEERIARLEREMEEEEAQRLK